MASLKKVREWLVDYYEMFDAEHSAMVFLKRVGECEVESFDDAFRRVNQAIDLHIQWANSVRPRIGEFGGPPQRYEKCGNCDGRGVVPVPKEEPGRFGKATHLVCAHCGGRNG